MTKDRVGAGLAVVAAIIGLVLVFTYRDAAGDDEGPAGQPAPPSVGQIAPGQPGEVHPGQVQPPPRQHAPQGDGDGDGDG